MKNDFARPDANHGFGLTKSIVLAKVINGARGHASKILTTYGEHLILYIHYRPPTAFSEKKVDFFSQK